MSVEAMDLRQAVMTRRVRIVRDPVTRQMIGTGPTINELNDTMLKRE